MRGSVRKRNGTWYYSFEIASVGGKRRRVERKGGATKPEAEKALRNAIREYEKSGEVFDWSNISVADYLDYWLKEYVELNLRLNTQVSYKTAINQHIKPVLGSYFLRSLKPAQLQEFFNLKYKEGLGKGYLALMKAIFSKSLNMAVQPYQLIPSNPTIYINMPKYEYEKKVLQSITLEEYNRVIQAFPRGNDYHMPLQIAFNTGMRVGEICALTWDCVDLENSTIRVEKTMIYEKGGTFYMGPPKTKSSEREIVIPKVLKDLLAWHQKEQYKNRMKYGPYYVAEVNGEPNRLVCTRRNGKPINLRSLNRFTEACYKKAGVRLNFHALRHTHATLLLEAGAGYKEIQERLGHSKIDVTMDTYAHVTKEMAKSTADLMDKISAKVGFPTG